MPGAAQEQQQQRPALVHVVLVRNGQHTDSTYLHITPDLVTVGDALRRVLPEAPPASDVVCETSDDRRQWARADTDIPLQPLIDDYGHRFLRFTVSGGGVFGGQSFTLPSIPFLGRFGKQSSHCRNRSISPKQLQQQNRDVEDGESKPQTPHDRSAKLFGVGRDLILSIMVGTAVYLLADVVLRETYSDPLVNDTLSSEQPAKLSAAGASQHAAAASSRTPQPQSARLQLPAATPVPPQNPHEAQRTPFSYYQGLPRGPSGCPGVHEAAADPNMLRQRGEGEWRRDFGGSGAFYRFCPAAGARRMTPDSLNTCLAGKKVLFAGDSNLRAVYLSLVEWLEGGYQEPEPRALNTSNRVILSNAWQPAHPQHPQALADPPGGISIYPQDWPSWEDFFLSRARRLEGRFCCDCYRHDPGRSPNWEGAGTGASDTSKEWMSRENMHYVSDKTGVQASFHLLHGDRGGRALAMSHTKGCVNASGSSTSPQAYHQQSWPGGWAWEGVVGNLAEVLRSKGYVADVVVLAGACARALGGGVRAAVGAGGRGGRGQRRHTGSDRCSTPLSRFSAQAPAERCTRPHCCTALRRTRCWAALSSSGTFRKSYESGNRECGDT
eukprot:TRINITY_DN3820_c7_g1_i1.p1 TRINITY_DN3820_c7_g1~~TRINITY_DN3820_c7_g1_i1.p1  ORF type:complete len:609 (+),score=95.86 TRINITY_DN3820_c7_g1_i1:253-2079(+)